MNQINNTEGFTLIEVMITSFVLAVGILAMSLMQIKAMDANASAFTRSDASLIAQNFLEELKRLPFNDPNLTAGTDLNAGAAVGGGAPTPAAADHQYDPANFSVINNTFQVSGSDLVDPTGRKYQLFWNVEKTPVVIGTNSYTPYCIIRLFLYWNSPLGLRHLQVTTTKE
jgi:type IV pilus assembly protein PilV